MLRTASILWTLAFVALAARPAAAFKERWHKAITFSALSFLDDKPLDEILVVHDVLDAPYRIDKAGVDEWHFNDCDFWGAAKNINRLYAEALGGPPDLPIDWTAFGQILHVAQDFYAHSNWVNIARDRLVDTGLEHWPVLAPYQTLDGNIVVVTGERSDVLLTRKPGTRTVTVRLPSSDTPATGLISGSAFLQMQCPKSVAIGHWDTPEEHLGLAKDYPCRGDEFRSACTLALRQTLHEWCRLVEMAKPDPAATAAIHRAIKPGEAPQAEAEALCRNQFYLRPDFTGGCS